MPDGHGSNKVTVTAGGYQGIQKKISNAKSETVRKYRITHAILRRSEKTYLLAILTKVAVLPTANGPLRNHLEHQIHKLPRPKNHYTQVQKSNISSYHFIPDHSYPMVTVSRKRRLRLLDVKVFKNRYRI